MTTSLDLPSATCHIADRHPAARPVLQFAQERHAGQRREGDGAPFVTHPVEVGSILSENDYPAHVVAAGLLHDVLEKSGAERTELEARFGPRVAALVAALTDPAIADDSERRAALRRQVAEAGHEAAAIFAADKISKVRELRHRVRRGPLDGKALAKLEHYRQSREMLTVLLPGNALVTELTREMRALGGSQHPALYG